MLNVEDLIFVHLDNQDQPSVYETKSTDSYLFSREQFDIDFLNRFDLDLSLAIDKVVNAGADIHSFESHLKLHKGHLFYESGRLLFEGGNSQFRLEARALEVPEYQLKITTRDASLGPLIAKLQHKIPIRGFTNALIELHGKGHSPHELASSVSGEINVGIENIQIPYEMVEALTADVFGWVLSRSKVNKYANLNCALMSFKVDTGIMESRVLVSDGPRVSLKGKAKFDLANETMDIVLLPKKKRRLFTSVTPIKITGSIQSPDVSAIPTKAAARELGMIAAFAPIILPARAVEKLISVIGDSDDLGGGCSNFEELGKELNIELDMSLTQ